MTKQSISLDFPHVLESELFKLYYTSFENINKDMNNINLNLLNGSFNRHISSMTYIIQFLSEGKVIEEISILCRYRTLDNMYKLKLIKHILNNKYSAEKMKDIYEGIQIGFPINSFVFSENMILSFTRIHNNNFMISAIDSEKKKKRLNMGVLTFEKTSSEQKITVEAVVKCIIKTNANISQKDMKRLFFITHSPNMNNDEVTLNLTNQYRISISFDKKKNTIHIFDIGIVNINFDTSNRSTVYSLISKPKTKMYVNKKTHKNIVSYSFSNYQAVY